MTDLIIPTPDSDVPDDLLEFLAWANAHADDPDLSGAAGDLYQLFESGFLGPDLPHDVMFGDGQEAMHLVIPDGTYLGMMCATMVYLVTTVRADLPELLRAYHEARPASRQEPGVVPEVDIVDPLGGDEP